MFLICMLQDENQLDAMPVIKTTQYPFTDDSYRPLAYGRLAIVAKKGLLVDLQAFERDPDIADREDLFHNSCVALSIQTAEAQPVLTAVFAADGRHAVFSDGTPVDIALSVNTYAGIDEQGWYWGVRCYLPGDLLSLMPVTPTQRIRANIYKFRGHADDHMGAAAPLQNRDIFSPGNLAAFSVIDF